MSTAAKASPTPDAERLERFAQKVFHEFSAAATAPLVLLGDRLGLFRALAEHGPCDSAGLAKATGTAERYVREWLACMAAAEYVAYDSAAGTFALTDEQRAVFVDEDSPFLMTGGFYSISSLFHDEPRVGEAFKTGRGIDWGEHNSCLFCGTERFFRPSYRTHLVGEWIPALEGVVEKLRAGGRVADVGCGHGVSTLLMAQAFPEATFVGFDLHAGSIAHARAKAEQSGLKNVTFETAAAKAFPGRYDLVTFFDCLHDMGDPAGAAAHTYRALNGGGSWMVVEPMAGDRLEDNLHALGRCYYAFSTMVCTPTSLSQEVGAALGAQAGEKRLSEAIRAGGFKQVRRAAQTPFNIVLEARK